MANGPRQPQQHTLAANHDAKQLLTYIKEQKVRVPETVIKFIKNTEATTEVFLTDLLGSSLQKTVEDAVIKATLNLKKDIHAIRTNTKNQSPSGRVRSFAEAIHHTPPPSHYQSNHGSNSSQGATPSELSRDRKIMVKLGDAAGIKRFRALTPANIRRKAQQARDKAYISTLDQPTLSAIQFIAAHQLKSDNLSLSLRSAKEAEVAHLHQN
ncbi:hypothetical protein Aspvir_003369 [Aspergillus viridinutans]|uniref:Uncharacterized protein n=1 Tax=Aspergillus viridinutans TaxID=75553 RepID=A0A9P3C506_ASPVI|nr:uncharacterized protein Aspvir_003369 [Aspergillus viridinutans]GIK07702.1 hypothetical protein Aspvir_003369 [Aspergillus viridinutans]